MISDGSNFIASKWLSINLTDDDFKEIMHETEQYLKDD